MTIRQRPTDMSLYRPQPAFNLLQLPIIGRILRHRWGRLTLQVPFFVIAILLIIDGFTGPQVASRNLATITPWVHYRGLVILALLLAGNLFCMGCPFHIPRTLAKRLSISGRSFPKALRNKWLAIGSLFTLFFLYEWLDLWASPTLTAWVIIAYFVGSFTLELIFSESAFCKYVCPLGTFNFVYATTSPTQIAVKDENTCANCAGKECVNGSWSATPVIRIDQIPVTTSQGTTVEAREVINDQMGVLGCGTQLFPPQIKTNMDCILCLDCVRACPHENIGLFVRQPGRELGLADAWSKRWDMSLLVIILAFMGVMNAFGMVPPIYSLQETLVQTLGLQSELLVLLLIFISGNIILPVVLTFITARITQALTRTQPQFSLRQIVGTFAPAFVPVGFGIWFAHYGFHFLIAPLSIIPVIQEFLGQTGDWARFSTPVSADIISIIQIVALLGGFLRSLVIAQNSALRVYKRQGFIALIPWAVMLVLLMLGAFAIFSMPMEMRGSDLFA